MRMGNLLIYSAADNFCIWPRALPALTSPRVSCPTPAPAPHLDGDKSLGSLPPEFIVALIDSMTPHNANAWLRAFRHFIRWAKTRKLIKHDPSFDIKVKLPKSDGFHTWSDSQVAQFEAHH